MFFLWYFLLLLHFFYFQMDATICHIRHVMLLLYDAGFNGAEAANKICEVYGPETIKERAGWEVLEHPPYSPDLAPSDYHLFRSLQHFLRGKEFRTMDEIKENISRYFASKPPGFYVKGISRLQERWEKVLEFEGDYFVD